MTNRGTPETSIPYIDPNVEHVGVSRLRSWNATSLSKLNKTFVIQDNDTPLAVLLSFEQFMVIQQKIIALANTAALLEGNEANRLVDGLRDAADGKTVELARAFPDEEFS